ncbi:molybdopterin molybdotransferase MoeA [Curtobacterium sp. S6]|uniref:molybdopterin molybdotransferase MoeA n=1 Tax=Curtobacterium sp. S6 TaxID=1479623 RepID=UPI0009E6F0E6|nr:molybdopterin molybdotransferase MoeA [Curtobacterium sp. S6]
MSEPHNDEGAGPRTPKQHRESVIDHWRSFGASVGREAVAVDPGALGRILSDDVAAPADSPRFDNSQMDGFALTSPDASRADRRFRIGPTVAAGADPGELYPGGLPEGTACPIMTGAKIPEGTGAVVPVERCEPPEFGRPGADVIVPPAPAGQFLRLAGSDIRGGDTVLRAGQVVSPHLLAVLAGLGHREVMVRGRPRVVVCTGGEEIVGSGDGTETGGDVLGSSRIYDANGPMLEALCRDYGLEPVGRVLTGDRPAEAEDRMRQAVRDHRPDLVVTSGGISHGAFEVIRQVIGNSASAWFGHVSQQPGGPQGYGDLEGVPVVCLPGNPVSTMVSFRMVLAPAAARVWGSREPETGMAILHGPASGLEEKTQYRRGRLGWDGPQRTASFVGGPGSHLLAQTAGADCLIEIAPGARLAGGEAVTVHALRPAAMPIESTPQHQEIHHDR